MKIKTFAFIFLFFTVSILFFTGCSGERQKAIRVGNTIPPFTETDINGNPFSLASHNGRPVIVRFFLINCPYCKADTPIFNKFYDKYRQKGFEIVYINNNGANPEEVQNFTDELTHTCLRARCKTDNHSAHPHDDDGLRTLLTREQCITQASSTQTRSND